MRSFIEGLSLNNILSHQTQKRYKLEHQQQKGAKALAKAAAHQEPASQRTARSRMQSS